MLEVEKEVQELILQVQYILIDEELRVISRGLREVQPSQQVQLCETVFFDCQPYAHQDEVFVVVHLSGRAFQLLSTHLNRVSPAVYLNV